MGRILFKGMKERHGKKIPQEMIQKQSFSGGGAVFPFNEWVECEEIPPEIKALSKKQRASLFMFHEFEKDLGKLDRKEAKKHGTDNHRKS